MSNTKQITEIRNAGAQPGNKNKAGKLRQHKLTHLAAESEKAALTAALASTEQRSKAWCYSGLSRATFYRRLKQYGINSMLFCKKD